MISTELASRILLTVIVGALAIDFCNATAKTTADSLNRDQENTTSLRNRKSLNDEQPPISSSLDSPVSPAPESSFSYTSPYVVDEESLTNDDGRFFREEMLEDPEPRLMPGSAEAGILLPDDDDDFPRPRRPGDGSRRFSGDYGTSGLPQAVSFPTKPIALRITNGKALEPPTYPKEPGKGEEKATYYIRNNCFGPRCAEQQQNNEQIIINSPEDWKNVYYSNKEVRTKNYEGENSQSKYIGQATSRYEDNVMESLSSNFHSQIAIPFAVVNDNSLKGSQQSTFSKKSGIDRFSRMTSTTSTPMTPEGWVKLKAVSPDAYDPFRFARNQSVRDTVGKQSIFSKRDSSTKDSNSFSKRAGVEINPESFADRWGWSSNIENDNRRGSPLPTWLEEQLKYGNRNSDQGKNWVKLEPIPVAGVSISKWVPKGTPSQDLPTTSWQTNRDQPSGGSQWWDRIDDNRILTGNRPSPFLRPNGNGGGGNINNNKFGDMGWDSKGSSLSSYDRYPTNSWNDIIYPEGPTSATVSWQQNKGISGYPSSFSVSGGGNSGGWSTGSDTRKPIVPTGSWSAPPESNNRFPSFINRFNDHRATSYPVKQASEDDPRWVLISNTRRVASSGNNRGSNHVDRNKVSSYINRLHPDLDRKSAFPFYERGPTPHRHGKDYWPFQVEGTTYPPTKDEAFHKLNATLSTLTPIIFHRRGTTMRPPIVGTLRPPQSHSFMDSYYEGGSFTSEADNNRDLINSISSTLSPLLSTYVGDGRATSSNAVTSTQSSTSKPVRHFLIPGKIRQGLFKNINPVYAAVGAGMIPATLAAVMPMMMGRRRRRDVKSLTNQPQLKYFYSLHYNLP